MRTISALALAGSLLASTAAFAGSHTGTKKTTNKTASGTITCPFMHKTVAKKDAIKVTANGKSMYVCCKGCESAAKKQLMAKK